MIKLIVQGNVLMGDDGIAITVAKQLEQFLIELGIELIYVETDPCYSIYGIQKEDYLIFLDGASLGKQVGDITVLSLEEYQPPICKDLHELSFLDFLKLYHENARGILLGIEVEDVKIRYGLSRKLMQKVSAIEEQVKNIIIKKAAEEICSRKA